MLAAVLLEQHGRRWQNETRTVCLNPELTAAHITIQTRSYSYAEATLGVRSFFLLKLHRGWGWPRKKYVLKEFVFKWMHTVSSLWSKHTFAFLPLVSVRHCLCGGESRHHSSFPESKYCQHHLVKSVLASAQTFLLSWDLMSQNCPDTHSQTSCGETNSWAIVEHTGMPGLHNHLC